MCFTRTLFFPKHNYVKFFVNGFLLSSIIFQTRYVFFFFFFQYKAKKANTRKNFHIYQLLSPTSGIVDKIVSANSFRIIYLLFSLLFSLSLSSLGAPFSLS